MRPASLLFSLCLLFALPVLAESKTPTGTGAESGASRGDETNCPTGSHAEGAAPPAGLELRCVDAQGRAEGVWRTWYDNGQMMSERTMKQGLEHGRQRSWWPNGQLMMDGMAISGNRVQGFRFWSITGQPSKLPPRKSPAAPAPSGNTTKL